MEAWVLISLLQALYIMQEIRPKNIVWTKLFVGCIFAPVIWVMSGIEWINWELFTNEYELSNISEVIVLLGIAIMVIYASS